MAEQAATPARFGKRSIALAATLAFALLIAAGAWLAGSRIESPADAAARSAPPEPSPILVPVERKVLSSTIVTRGTARFGLPQKISIAPSALKPAPGLIATLPLRNTALEEGSVMFAASGRPVFVLQGRIPAYRDLAPGVAGEDVHQLEQALVRLGFDPGPVDGRYDARTAAAVVRWYGARRWEAFGPTREQLAAVAALERDWGDARKAQAAAVAAAAAAALSVESARASADHASQAAEAELAARRGDPHRAPAADGGMLLLESERAKAEQANAAAAAEVAAQTAERALVVLDPRQPGTSRSAADAKLELARAAARKTRIEGELTLQAAERDSRLAAGQLALAEAALRSARLEGRKNVQAAIDAQTLAELDARLTTQRAGRLAAELDAARSRIGVQVPVDEIVFIPALPVRVEEVSAQVGGSAVGPVLSVTDNQLAVDTALALDAAPLVKPGMPVAIDEQDLGIKASGVIEQVASTPGTRGADGYHVHVEVRVVETASRLDGQSLRLTIPIQSTRGAVLAVPVSALSLAADGRSHVQVQASASADGNGNSVLRQVIVQPGLSAGGYVEITPVDGSLAPGQLVVVGYKRAEKETP